MKDVAGFEFPTEMSAQSYYGYIRVAKMLLGCKNVLALVQSLNADDAGLKCLEISHLENIGLYTETTKKLLVFIIEAKNFRKIQNKPGPFHLVIIYTTAKVFRGELRVVFLGHRTDPASEFVEF